MPPSTRAPAARAALRALRLHGARARIRAGDSGGEDHEPLVAAKMPAVKASPAMADAPWFGAFARLGTRMTH
jgi:hypothetical protein